jgi:hypothetical protein
MIFGTPKTRHSGCQLVEQEEESKFKYSTREALWLREMS